tara:strand:- start:337 stop:519 length:183 start_codon:yes stop_codon:yes gene_type:complete
VGSNLVRAVLREVSSRRVQAARVSNPGKKQAEMDQAPGHRVGSQAANRQAAQQDLRQQEH